MKKFALSSLILLSISCVQASSSYSIISSLDNSNYGVVSNPESLNLNSSIVSEPIPRSNRSNSFSSLRSRLASFNILDIPEVQSIYIEEESSFIGDLSLLESILLDEDLTNSLFISDNISRFTARYEASLFLPEVDTTLRADEVNDLLNLDVSIQSDISLENDKNLLLKNIQNIKNKLIAKHVQQEISKSIKIISLLPMQLNSLVENRVADLKSSGVSSGSNTYISNIWNRIGSSWGKQPYYTNSTFSIIGIDSSTNFNNLIVGILYSNNYTENNFIISKQNVITDSFGVYAYFITDKELELTLTNIFGESKIFLINPNYSFQTQGRYNYSNLGLQKELITLIPNVSIIPKVGKSYFKISIDSLKGENKPTFYYKKNQILDIYGIGAVYNHFLEDKLIKYKLDYEINKYSNSSAFYRIGLLTSINKEALIWSIIYNYNFAKKYFDNSLALQINYSF